MNDNDIIKAWEWHISPVHANGMKIYSAVVECSRELAENTLDLINRLEKTNRKNERIIELADKTIETQKAEIDELQLKKSELEIELKAMRGAANSYKAEVERLHNLNGEITDHFSKMLEATTKKGNSTKRIAEREAVKEFEKRVLSLFPIDKKFTTISRFSVKQITKEMIGVIEND